MLPAGLLLSSCRMSFRDTVQAATPAPTEGKLQTKKTHCTNLFVVCACVFVLFTGLLYHSVRFIAISFSCRLCGSVASPALLYCAPASFFRLFTASVKRTMQICSCDSCPFVQRDCGSFVSLPVKSTLFILLPSYFFRPIHAISTSVAQMMAVIITIV